MSGRELLGSIAEARLWIDAAGRERLERALAHCDLDRVAARTWSHDHTLWKPSPVEIVDRLGWLRSPAAMRAEIGRIRAFVEAVRRDGIRSVLLLGMGGSSLASEVFTRTFGAAPGHPQVSVLDSTDPGAVLSAERRFNPETTLYLVSTKSGGTIETLSSFKYFYTLAVERLGRLQAGLHLAAITDPGSGLEMLAREAGAREIFLNDPDVGGRFSALTFFGIVPAALDGVDLPALLDSAEDMASRCGPGASAGDNPGVALGALAGSLALGGRDKLTLVCSARISAFGAWVEQLVAESTGKEGRGILPVLASRIEPLQSSGADRLFVFLLLEDDRDHDGAIAGLASQGHPVLELRLRSPYDLGGEFFRWEFATAVMGRFLGVNPFDQPDVESAKVQASRALAVFRDLGELPPPGSEITAAGAASAVARLVDAAPLGGYVAIQAFVDPESFGAAVGALADAVAARSDRPVTLGYGPRFLHSTGQLHKGGAPGGVFLQLVTANPADVMIPDGFHARSGTVGFGVLKAAQSLGDLRALEAAGRRVLRVHLGDAGPEAPRRLLALAQALRDIRTGGG